MRRGEIWTVAGASDYAGKPRPSLILQSEDFQTSDSVTICGFTSDLTEASLIRIRVQPSAENGLYDPSDMMADKITTVPQSKLGQRIGHIEVDGLVRLEAAVLLFLGLAKSSDAS